MQTITRRRLLAQIRNAALLAALAQKPVKAMANLTTETDVPLGYGQGGYGIGVYPSGDAVNGFTAEHRPSVQRNVNVFLPFMTKE